MTILLPGEPEDLGGALPLWGLRGPRAEQQEHEGPSGKAGACRGAWPASASCGRLLSFAPRACSGWTQRPSPVLELASRGHRSAFDGSSLFSSVLCPGPPPSSYRGHDPCSKISQLYTGCQASSPRLSSAVPPQDIFSEVVLCYLQRFGAELEASALAAESLFPAVNSHPAEMLFLLQDLISVLKTLHCFVFLPTVTGLFL